MRRPGPPIQSIEDRRRLCLWLLDKVRQNLPLEDRPLAQHIFRVEAKLNEDRLVDHFAPEQLVQIRVVSPNGEWLHEAVFTMPFYGAQGRPDFEGQSVAMVPSYSNAAVALRVEVQSELARVG